LNNGLKTTELENASICTPSASGRRSAMAALWAGKWLQDRVWEEAVPAAARPEQVFIRENTPEWRVLERAGNPNKHLCRETSMTSQRGIERGRGAKESGQVFAALRARWPLAFPAQSRSWGSAVGVARAAVPPANSGEHLLPRDFAITQVDGALVLKLQLGATKTAPHRSRLAIGANDTACARRQAGRSQRIGDGIPMDFLLSHFTLLGSRRLMRFRASACGRSSPSPH
jgi:hypothetical protein